MAVMHVTRAIRFAAGIKTENHLHDLTPVGPLLIGIKQPKLGLEVPLVVRGDMRQVGRMIVKGYLRHGENPRQSSVEIRTAQIRRSCFGPMTGFGPLTGRPAFTANSQEVRVPAASELHRIPGGKQDRFVEYTP